MPDLNRRAAAGAIAAALIGASSAIARPTASAGFDVSNVVTKAAAIVRAQYVDPDVANQIADLLLANLKAGAYRSADTPVKLAEKLTVDLRSLTHDLHLSVSYDPPAPTTENAEEIAEDDLNPRFTNYGVQTVARLAGDVGLIKLTHFPSPPTRFAARYAAAMELLQDTSAMVLDLTVNHGGGSDTAAYLLSYFLDGEMEIGRINYRNEPVEIIKTSKEVAGRRYGETRPVFVAISEKTFSAGEAIALQLRTYRHAVLVGHRTRGGAHGGNFFKLPNDLQIFVVTGKGEGHDWEGVGVPPDVETTGAAAVGAAHRLAVQTVLDKTTDPKTAQVLRNVLDRRIENLSSFAA